MTQSFKLLGFFVLSVLANAYCTACAVWDIYFLNISALNQTLKNYYLHSHKSSDGVMCDNVGLRLVWLMTGETQ